MPASGAKAPLYLNRELSWAAFNQRVLSEAANPDNPLFERMKFLSIVSTNLDEFFMVRVASLRDQVRAGYKKTDPAGMKPREQLEKLQAALHRQVKEQYEILNVRLWPELNRQGIFMAGPDSLTREQAAWLERYFEEQVFPVLTPMAVDSSHAFPLVANRCLYLGVFLADKHGKKLDFATVQVPNVLPRVAYLPSAQGETAFMLMETVISLYIHQLFPGRQVVLCQPYRITRNADLTFDEEEAADLLSSIQKSLKKRKWGAVIRLEMQKGADAGMASYLKAAFEVEDSETYYVDGPIHLDFLMKKLYGLSGFESHKYAPFQPAAEESLVSGDLFQAISQRDYFFYHPYDSFDPVVRFVHDAAWDPDVLAIKQTLYRVSGQSPIVAALAQAAENGKQVTALVELKARFDEENNIHWSLALEKAGCHVIYGVKGLKTHSKITLVVRRENGAIRRYTHLATGNYNDVTARLYTDMGILTANQQIGRDAGHFFNMVTGFTETPPMKLLTAAPAQLRPELKRLIDRERDHALLGRPARIDAKMNSLVDPEMIAALYEASQAGVEIDLTVRGICCLVPGVEGMSERITVRSIVGRFLEHARIFRFQNGASPETYLSSADWMPRNLDKRVELMFPILDGESVKKISRVLEDQKRDTAKAWILKPDGRYERRSLQDRQRPSARRCPPDMRCPPGGEAPFNSQEALIPRPETPAQPSHTMGETAIKEDRESGAGGG